MEEINEIIKNTKEDMESSLKHLDHAFVKIRAGKASPAMLDGVLVEYYGAPTPLSQVANITVPDAMSISIQPWERSILHNIERAIINSNLGFAPNNNGEFVIINIPPMTEERRKEIAKMAKAEADDAKVGIRNHRQDANKKIKTVEGVSEDLKKTAEEEVQKLTDTYSQKIDEKLKAKEAEILKV